jgi:hypothetical protein
MPNALLHRAAVSGRAPPVPVQACATCGINPRACSGALSRCIDCLKASVDVER